VNLFAFDPVTETATMIGDGVVADAEYDTAKCAGGVLAPDGSIWCIPANGRYLLKLEFDDVARSYPDRVLSSIYFSDY
jgi:hypothetical protein